MFCTLMFFLRRKLKEVKRTFRFNDQVFKDLRSSQIKVSFNKAWVTYKFKTIVGDMQENPEVSYHLSDWSHWPEILRGFNCFGNIYLLFCPFFEKKKKKLKN